MNSSNHSTWPADMAPAPQFCGEDQRLNVMASFGMDSLDGDTELTDIARFAAQLCDVPICLVSLVEEERQRFLARQGIEAVESPRSTSFCAHAMLGQGIMIIPNALDHPVFKDFALVHTPPHVRFYAGMPLVSGEGAPLGALCVIDDKPRPEGLSDFQLEGLKVLGQAVMRRLYAHREKLAASAALASNEAQFSRLADSIPDIAWSSDASGNFDYFNKRWYEFAGTAERPKEGWEHIFHPDDRAQWSDEWLHAMKTGEDYETEYRVLRADGQWRWMLARAVPIRRADGAIERWFGTLTDVDTGHRLSESRELIAGELAHRIKNIFAVIGGLIGLRARGDDKLVQFAEQLNSTIQALSRAQGLIDPLSGDGAELLVLLRSLMAPYANAEDAVIAITGDDVSFGVKSATPLALVFHELATNAAKYGALSQDGGRVDITVTKGAEAVSIKWRESGGPTVSPPQASGFGSRLLGRSIKNQLGGAIEHDWLAHGVEVHITVPLERLAK